MTIQDYEEKFREVLSADIKAVPQKIFTLFDVAQFPHYETVISNFYAFYLNPSGTHGFGDLFLSALTNIILEKRVGGRIVNNLNLCTVEREVYTGGGKFIDIVVKEPSQDPRISENAIIIENKIHAPLYNDLNEYYDHVKVENNKVGVVLSLKRELTFPATFINITHLELISRVEQSSGLYFINTDVRQLVIFREFIQNLKNMASRSDLSEQYNFYFKHEAKVRDIAALYNTLVADVFQQVNDACEKLEMGLEIKALYSSKLRYFTSEKAPVYFTIWLADLMNGKTHLQIIVELNDAGMKNLDEINKIDFTPDEQKLMHETSRVRQTYIHYARKVLDPVTSEQVKNFTDFIHSQISESPLRTIFTKIENRLVELQS